MSELKKSSEKIASPFKDVASYRTPDKKRRCLLSYLSPALAFYSRVLYTVFRASRLAKKGLYDGAAWVKSSREILDWIELSGGKVTVEGLDNINLSKGPAVFVGNHMSTLETFLLPSMIRPKGLVTFVIKKQLLTYPVFGWVMRARKPIAVGRDNPRKDLSTVMKEGKEKLEKGISIIIFPQTTRTSAFDPSSFNSMAAKLAARSKVPLVPVALKTDFWSNGKKLKDFGPVYPEREVHFRFAEPIEPEGKGDAAHRTTVRFITEAMEEWQS